MAGFPFIAEGRWEPELPRQQTLRTTIDWSHALLTPAEQTLLRRLCVFAGRFTVDDIECVFAIGALLARSVGRSARRVPRHT